MQKNDSFGICSLCNDRISKVAVARHMASCAPSHDLQRGKTGALFHLRVEDKGAADFWLNLEIKGDASLRDLDYLLRRIWLECCGHMSAFKINALSFVSSTDNELDYDSNEGDINVQIADILVSGQRFRYKYDFGSTTDLMLRVLSVRSGIIGQDNTRLLARNEPQVWACATCGGAATSVCAFCIDDVNAFFCEKHVPEHSCGKGEGFLPVVNSPRMGVCAYSG